MLQEEKTNETGKRKSGDAYTSLLEDELAAKRKMRPTPESPAKQSTRRKEPEEETQQSPEKQSTGTHKIRKEPEREQDPHHDGEDPWFDPFAEASDQSVHPAMMDDDDDDDDGSVETNQDQVEEIPFKASRRSITEFKAYTRNAS